MPHGETALTQTDKLQRLAELEEQIIHCQRCPRLLAWCQQVAQEKVKRFAGDTYWGKPVPSFGDPSAQLLVLGLAPAAHGGNRTGRVFTGDRSGDWLYRALHRAGFANQPTSVHKEDGLVLNNCYITAVNHCAPPENKPLREEMEACHSYLVEELRLLPQLKVVVALGKIAFDATINTLKQDFGILSTETTVKPKFGHGLEYSFSNGFTVIASFHPSQQNTFTGRLTEEMLDAVFHRAHSLVKETH